MIKYFVDIKEIHDAVVSVVAPVGTSRDELLKLALDKFEDEGEESNDYNRTLEKSEWTVRDETGNFIK